MGYGSIVILLYYVISISFMFFLYNRYKVCPELLWCGMQLLMFFGITRCMNINLQSDIQLISLYLIGLLSFIISNVVFRLVKPPNKTVDVHSNLDNYKSRKFYLYSMIIICVLLSLYFFAKGGGNVFLNSLKAMISGKDYSAKYSRMGLLSVSGVGYIYQLRVIVLPLCVLYYTMINKKKITTILLNVIMIIFLIGTGQRGGLVSFIAIALLTVYYWFNYKKEKGVVEKKPIKKFKIYISIILIAGILFSLSTVMNLRVSENGTIFSAISQRFLEDNQTSALIGFRYIKMQNIQHGRDWLNQLVDILPGKNDYITLDTRIFAFLYGGSMDGTSPPCIWGSAYYNFGVYGVIIMGIITSYIAAKIHYIFSRKDCDELEIIVYSSLQFLLAFWVVSGPVTLFNSGFITVIILYFILKFALRHRIVFKRGGN